MADPKSPPAQRAASAPTLPDKIVALHESLAAARIPHAMGGALALAYYAEPRVTIDVDINVFVSTERWPQVRDALSPLDVGVNVNLEALERDGQVRLWWDRTPVDLFFSYDPFHDEMKGMARRVPFGETTIPILAPEHLAVCKAMFDRPKDWLDIEQILVATDPLDLPEIEGWLEAMAGESNPRMTRLREITTRLGLDRA
jgi:hypothetical protein